MATTDPHQDIRDLANENAAKDEATRSIGVTDGTTTAPAPTDEPDEAPAEEPTDEPETPAAE